jgi:hypothetical protein
VFAALQEDRMMRVSVPPLVAAAVFAGTIAMHAQTGQPAAAARPPQPSPPCGPGQPSSSKSVDKASRCFELRTYTVREGSSIELLHSRFRDHTSKLFIKHGMTIVGYWQPVSKPDTLIYMLAYKDNAARDASWAAFNTDPEWVKTRTEMVVNVQVEALFLGATDYSPLK